MEDQQEKTYQEKIAAQLKEFAAKIDELNVRADQAKAEAKVKYAKQIEELRLKQESARQKLQKLKEAGGGALGDLKRGLDAAVAELNTALHDALSRFKEKEKEEEFASQQPDSPGGRET
jgi:3-dehydroquinate synthetase